MASSPRKIPLKNAFCNLSISSSVTERKDQKSILVVATNRGSLIVAASLLAELSNMLQPGVLRFPFGDLSRRLLVVALDTHPIAWTSQKSRFARMGKMGQWGGVLVVSPKFVHWGIAVGKYGDSNRVQRRGAFWRDLLSDRRAFNYLSRLKLALP